MTSNANNVNQPMRGYGPESERMAAMRHVSDPTGGESSSAAPIPLQTVAPGGLHEATPRCQSVEQLAEDGPSTEREDLLDQHVAYFLKHHPEVHAQNNIVRVRPGVYNLNGREISVEWHYSEDPDKPGYLITVDGPLRQPFADYMQGNENGIYYDETRLGRSNLAQISKGQRLSFGDGNKMYSRLEAMKVAKEQALVREKAAEYANGGMTVPQQELMEKYQKTLAQKLGGGRQRRPEGEQVQTKLPDAPPAPADSPMPVPLQTMPPPGAAPSPPPKPSPASVNLQGKSKLTHGAPQYCANHDASQKRQKTKPRNLPCSKCQAVIQTNYIEFSLCPQCSEKDHRCMCCGAPAIGAASAPPVSTPSRDVSDNRAQTAHMSPVNLFGSPDLFNGAPQPQNQPASRQQVFASGNMYMSPAAANPYASQNAFASYKPVASQNVMVGHRQPHL